MNWNRLVVVTLITLAGFVGSAEAQERVYVFGNKHLSMSDMRDVLDALSGSGSGGGGSGGSGSFGSDPTDFTALELRQMKQILDEEYAKQEAERLRLLKAKQEAWLQQCQSNFDRGDKERMNLLTSMYENCKERGGSDFANFFDLLSGFGWTEECYRNADIRSHRTATALRLDHDSCKSKIPQW